MKLIYLYVFLSMVDLGETIYGVLNGFKEYNPFFNTAGIPKMVIFKILGTGLVFIIYKVLYKRSKRSTKLAGTTIVGLQGVFVFLNALVLLGVITQ